jgi:hypothetical protein
VGFAVQQMWTCVICALGFVIFYYGLEVVDKMGGKYWEMWHFAWEDGWFVFKPHYMPKKYAMMILPISGAMICVAAFVAMIEDVVRFKRGTFEVEGGTGGDA